MLVLSVFGRSQSKESDNETFLTIMFIVATVCSSCFWTLVARSTLGGMVFNAATIFLISLVGAVSSTKLIPGFSFESPLGFKLIISSGVVYSALFLWLGLRKFARLELRDNISSEGNTLSLSVPWLAKRMTWLRCQPHGAVGNLIRKELHLQKPVFTICVVFTLCSLVLLALRLLAPSWGGVCNLLFYVLTFVYMPVSLLLAGAISLGDEKTLGLAAWHLTLPVSAWRQWLVKIGVSSIVGMLLGAVLPAFYLWLRLFSEGPEINQETFQTMMLAAALVLTISFWAAMFTASTLRALLLGMFCLVSVLTCLFLSNLGIQHSVRSQQSGLSGSGLSVVFLAIIVTALTQSFLLFRRPKPRVWLPYSAIIALVAILFSVWCFGL